MPSKTLISLTPHSSPSAATRRPCPPVDRGVGGVGGEADEESGAPRGGGRPRDGAKDPSAAATIVDRLVGIVQTEVDAVDAGRPE